MHAYHGSLFKRCIRITGAGGIGGHNICRNILHAILVHLVRLKLNKVTLIEISPLDVYFTIPLITKLNFATISNS